MVTFEEEELITVYVAGAITPTDSGKHPQVEFLENVQRGINMCVDLIFRGYAPVCTFFDFLYWIAPLPKEGPRLTIETIHKVSTSLMCRCEILFITLGSENSAGTKKEIKKAKKLGIPVCYTDIELDECRDKILEYRRKYGNS